MKDNTFSISFENFQDGLAPLAFVDDKTFLGSKGQASVMQADIISRPGFLTQSPALADITNGNQAGVVNELIRFILDNPTATDTTFAVGATKLFKLSNTTVASGGSPSWPQTITNMTKGESIIKLGTNLYILHNKASGGDIAKMVLSTSAITSNWGSVTNAALQDALHPVAVKEDVMVFGNGRYAGVYFDGLTLDVDKLDFGSGSEVADVIFSDNVWWIAVNTGVGGRTQSHVYMYDGSAISTILLDEAGMGVQKIGFLYVLNGIVFVAYEDLTSDGYIIGYFAGRQIKPLRYFPGALPDHRQKTLYKNTLLFISDDAIYSCGAVVQQLPVQISKLADAGYDDVGGIAAPFGVPIVASYDGGTNYRLAKFSGYSTDSIWKSIFVDVTRGKDLGHVNTLIVYTKALAANAKAEITLEGDQGDKTSLTHTVTGTGKHRFKFDNVGLGNVEDLRLVINYEHGNATNDCPIRKVTIGGNFVER